MSFLPISLNFLPQATAVAWGRKFSDMWRKFSDMGRKFSDMGRKFVEMGRKFAGMVRMFAVDGESMRHLFTYII